MAELRHCNPESMLAQLVTVTAQPCKSQGKLVPWDTAKGTNESLYSVSTSEAVLSCPGTRALDPAAAFPTMPMQTQRSNGVSVTAQHLPVYCQRLATNNPPVSQKLGFAWELAVPCPNPLSQKEPRLIQLREGWGQLLHLTCPDRRE